MNGAAATDPLLSLREAGIDPDTLVMDARGTLRPPTAPSHSPVVELPPLDRGQLQILERLGVGGHAVVDRAVQVPLHREVAIKRASREARSDQLITEARITGHLEHPNIVPIHALGRDEEGAVVLVMKRIEGVEWLELLKERPDDLDRHLDVLVEVCRAAHFAHERGVLHRDLKPSNVMLGPFGEVYVLDWGIAAGLAPGAPSTTSAPRTANIVGTPGYMAREMCLKGSALDRRTDVYQLGAILHRVLTGYRPHGREGESPAYLLARTLTSDGADPGPSVPAGLREICVRATRRDPADRFESAAALADALERHQKHAATLRLVEQATARLERIDDDDDAVAARAYHETAFGLRQALSEWPDLEAARDALHRAHERVAWRALRQGRLDVAAQASLEMDEVPAELARALGEAETQRNRAHALVADYDVRVGQRLRGLGAATVTLVSGGLLSLLGWQHLTGGRETDLFELLAVNTAVLVVFVVVSVAVRFWRLNLLSKQAYLGTVFILVVVVLVNVGAIQLGLNGPQFATMISWCIALGLGVIALADKRVAVGALSFAIGGLAIPFFPDAALLINGASTVIGVGIVAVNLIRADPPNDADHPAV